MKNRSLVLVTVLVAVAVFGIGAFVYKTPIMTTPTPPSEPVAAADTSTLIRPHSPILGRVDAPVTIVEFFDPSCEACQASFPFVEEILSRHPDDLRVVLRYAPFHEGSDEAVKILEAARLQNLFEPVLKALFAGQAEWAIHGAPNLGKAWDIAGTAGLDFSQAKIDAAKPEIAAVLKQDMADLQTNNVRQTPTFFVNGKRLVTLGPQPFNDLVEAEIKASKE